MRLQFFTQNHTVNQRIFRAALTVALATIVVKAGATIKDLAIAGSFGRNDSLDAFLFAFILPSFAVALVVGAVSAALVPVLVDTRQKEGAAAGRHLLSNVLLLTILVLLAVALFLGLLAPFYLPHLAHNFSPGKIALTRNFLYLLVPWLVTSGVAMFIGYVLNSVEKFAVPALVPILTPLAILACIVLWTRPATGYSLVLGTLIGSFLEVALLYYLVRKHELLGALRWYGLTPQLRAVLAQTGPMMAGSLLMGATPVVDQYMASLLAPGSVSALSYGSKVTTALLAMGATALSTATLPYFSKMAAENDWQGCRHTLKRYSVLVFAASVPVMTLLIAFSRPLIRILFQRGAFTSFDTDIVSRVQACYALQIPFYVLSILFVRFISSVRRNDLLMYAAAMNLIVDITMNLVLMRIWGVAGIALSTSIVMFVSLVFLSLCSYRLFSERVGGAPASIQASARQQS